MQSPTMRRNAIVLCAALLAVATATHAEEVIVRNDSLGDNDPALIIGDFIVGEHAGVRLTSPCNGTIVGIQILFLADSPDAQPALHNGIYINEGDTFPMPGAQLEFLEAPLLTPGFLNEFRHVDEAGTIPIHVPVTQGQQFYITLEFGEPTDVGGGGASVVADTDGCQWNHNVLYAIPGGWLDFCALISGDLVIRAIVDCEETPGACCLPSGLCEQLTPTECADQDGTFQGEGVSCDDVTCPQPDGACCIAASEVCVDATLQECNALGGTWAGAETDCATYVCFPSGACCLPDGSCLDQASPDECSAQGGVFQGDGVLCADVECPEPEGACCLDNGNCVVFTASDCQLVGGTWAGPDTDCSDADENGTADACEAAIACPGDMDCSGLVDFDDIAGLIKALEGQAAYDAAYPNCRWLNGDVNGDENVTFDDIAPFIDLFGASCD